MSQRLKTAPSLAKREAQILRQAGVPPFSYGDLRERGIALTQSLSGEIWTDYNHHDPGVTLLEAVCFALSEGPFGAERPVADLLTAPNGRIQYRRHGLHSAEKILPCRPTTELDLLRWILDRVPQIRDLRMQMPGESAGIPNGMWRMALRAPQATMAVAAARAYWAQRNLGEDLAGLPQVLKPRACTLHLEISVEGARDVTDILVELVQRCASFISAAPRRQSMQTRMTRLNEQGEPISPSELFNGPSLQFGWIASEDLARDPASRLFFSDLSFDCLSIEGIAQIHRLELEAEGLQVRDGALPWHGEDWALQLQWPESGAELRDWQIRRRGSCLTIDQPALLRKLADLQQVGLSTLSLITAGASAAASLPRPAGHYLPPYPYHAAFKHLPPVYQDAQTYRTGEGQAQFIAYQALLEQWLAHGDAQLQHLRRLYSLEAKAEQSYWWQMLDSSQLPNLDSLYLDDVERGEQFRSVLASLDEGLSRREQVLDHLLALHGEECGQSSLRALGWYYSPQEWRLHLFECKRQFLLRIVRQTRDRFAGIDYSRPSLDRKGNTPALQERVALLLGFAHIHSRRLSQTIKKIGIGFASPAVTDANTMVSPQDLQGLSMWSPLRANVNVQLQDDIRAQQLLPRLRHYFSDLKWQNLPAAFLRCAVHADRYWFSASDHNHPLWLGPDEHGRWWPLAVRLSAGSVTAPAMYLHEFAGYVQRESEGMHLVEHILLWPVSESGQPVTADSTLPVPKHFYMQQISAVFPAWTARGSDAAFRYLAKETLELNCPAHLLAHLHWLNADEIKNFERVYQAWLYARQSYCASLSAPDQAELGTKTQNLNRCSAMLSRLLWSSLQNEGARA